MVIHTTNKLFNFATEAVFDCANETEKNLFMSAKKTDKD